MERNAFRSGIAVSEIERSTLKKVTLRIIPFTMLLYFAAFLDRVNVSFAALQMNKDLGFSPAVYGTAAGIFFVGYCIFEVPSNLILAKVGARLWIARIMITWSFISGATAFVWSPNSFYVARCFLGIAEAGFSVGILYYLSSWVPASYRAKFFGLWLAVIPLSSVLGGPLSGAILQFDGLGLAGWQWLFIGEAIPSLILGIIVLVYLSDKPMEACWLSAEEREWLTRTLDHERMLREAHQSYTVLKALINPRIIMLGVCYFGAITGVYGVSFWLPQIVKAFGVSNFQSGLIVAIPNAISAVIMIWWGYHSDRANERPWHIAIAALIGFLGLTISAYLADYPVLSVIAITIGSAGTLAILPVFWTLPASMLSGAALAGGMGLVNSLGNIGGFAGPFLVGWVKDTTQNFTYGLVALASFVLLTGILALLLGQPAALERAPMIETR